MNRAIFASYHPVRGALTLGDHHFLREFRRDGWECLWIHGAVTLLSYLQRPRAAFSDWRRWWQGPRPVDTPDGPVPEWVAASWLPFRETGWHRAFRWLRGALYPRARRVLRRAGFGAPDVLWIGNMRMIWLADLFPDAVVIHRVGDRMEQFPGSASDVTALQTRLVRRADVVIATAGAIADDLRALGVDAVRVPNGVETARFGGEVPAEPARLAPLPRPRALYVGAIESWFDWDALRACATGIGSGSVVLVGPERGAIPTDLPANVHRMGPVPYAEVPAWMRHSDLGLMPFLDTPLTQDVSPLKVFEYLAAGLPVVARDLRETRASEVPVRLVPDAPAFEVAVREVAAQPADPERWRAAAAPHDWSVRMDVVRDRIRAAREARG